MAQNEPRGRDLARQVGGSKRTAASERRMMPAELIPGIAEGALQRRHGRGNAGEQAQRFVRLSLPPGLAEKAAHEGPAQRWQGRLEVVVACRIRNVAALAHDVGRAAAGPAIEAA